MDKRCLITTPIYYVNDQPHIGHAYTTIAADVLARFHRINQEEVFFLTGTDEHGSKVAETAKRAGKTPQELCNINHKFFVQAWKNLDITYDYFVRTTDSRHEKAVWALLEKMKTSKTPDKKEVIYPGQYEGLYCVGCEKFVTEKDLQNGVCPEHPNMKIEGLSEKNYFFRLSSYLGKLKDLIAEDKIKILPEERKKETLGLIKQKIDDFSISREKVAWGVSLPFDPSQKAYVWVDALPNYISAIGYGDNPKEFKKWWKEAVVLHLIGKDILKFHAIYWPAMLLSVGEKPPDTIFAHGYFTVDNRKMGKSLGNVIDPNLLVKNFGSDATRYLLLTQFPFGQDGDVQLSRFAEKYNSDLANDLGNLVSRVLKMIQNYCDGKIPQASTYQETDRKLIDLATTTPSTVMESINDINLNRAIEQIMNLVKEANRYVESQSPWNLAKNGQKERLGTVLYVSSEVLRIISVLFYPVLPQKITGLRALLGFPKDKLIPNMKEESKWGLLKAGTEIKEFESLFPRILEEKAPKEEAGMEEINLEEFSKMDLRVANVLSAEKVSGADKLLKLEIKIGDQKKQIIAGIAQYYSPQDLIGRKIVVVANLKPAKVRGIESNGMLLAAKDGESLVLVTTDKDIKDGAKIN
ncbi:MAG: methionine--tRNA ligase [candidate division Zixibacteria bacterium]|nr:methionine--tRNA ligase [candidate division Zixibacteria bacterium]